MRPRGQNKGNSIITFVKNWIIARDLIGSAAIVYEPLYHARENATIKLSSGCSCKAKSVGSSNIFFRLFLIKTIVPLALVGYQMIIDHIQRTLVE